MISISVVMPVYNTPVFILKEAVDSILNQSFRDFEFIIIDDGSESETAAYLDALTDPRIKLLRNKANIGITKSLNTGFQAAQGKYIARMDADDISLKERFNVQYCFMESHPDAIMCGCTVEYFGAKRGHYYTKIGSAESYRVMTVFCNPGPLHPTMFIRREILVTYGISYNEDLIYAQDYGFVVDMSRCPGRIYNLPEVLLKRRYHEGRISVQHRETQEKCVKKTLRRLLEELLINVSEEDIDIHYKYLYWRTLPRLSDVYKCLQWITRLIKANHAKRLYSRIRFDYFAFRIFIYAIGQSFTPPILYAYVHLRQRILMSFKHKL